MAPSTKITRLAEHLRHRLHGDIKDIKLEYSVPSDESGDARVRFDRNIELAITKYGEKAVEKMLQRYYEKVKDVELEAELRVWEMISGPEPTFRDRAFEWGDKQEETHRRAQRVRAVHKRSEKARKEAGERKEQDVMARTPRELGKVKAEGGHGQEVEVEKMYPQGPREQGTQGGRQQFMTPILKPQPWDHRGAPAPRSNRKVHWRDVGWRETGR